MALVEVVRTLLTSEATFTQAMEFVREIGKVPITAKDNSGFVVNLLLVPFMLDAIRQLERGVASMRDIDTAMVLGCGHPMGPLTLCDFVGLDTLHRISEIMYLEHREERSSTDLQGRSGGYGYMAQIPLSDVAPGREVEIRCDGCSGPFAARVSFVSSQAEYAPPVLYSRESRAKLLFLVEARLASADGARLRPGQPVDVRPR